MSPAEEQNRCQGVIGKVRLATTVILCLVGHYGEKLEHFAQLQFNAAERLNSTAERHRETGSGPLGGSRSSSTRALPGMVVRPKARHMAG